MGCPARLPASEEYNDAAIIADGKSGYGLLLYDTSNNNTQEVMRYGTHLSIDLDEEITEGRLILQFDLFQRATQTSNGMTPIMLRDGGNREILSYTNGASEIGVSNNQWHNIEIVIDFDNEYMMFYVDGSFVEYAKPLPANITGLKTIQGNTPRGNQSRNPNVELSLIYDNFSVRVEGDVSETFSITVNSIGGNATNYSAMPNRASEGTTVTLIKEIIPVLILYIGLQVQQWILRIQAVQQLLLI